MEKYTKSFVQGEPLESFKLALKVSHRFGLLNIVVRVFIPLYVRNACRFARTRQKIS